MIGYAAGQLIYGPIANRFGRVKTLHIGLSIAILGTIFSILSSPFESFVLLLFGRFIEAIGCSVGLVISFTIINDFYYSHQARKIFAIFMVSAAIVPGIAIMIGVTAFMAAKKGGNDSESEVTFSAQDKNE